MSRSVGLLALVALLLVPAGQTRAASPDAARLVLGLVDLPRGFSIESAYRPKPDGQSLRFGWVDGYQTAFGNGPDILRDHVRVLATAMVFRTAAGARRAFSMSLTSCAAPPLRRVAISPTIGSDSASICAPGRGSGLTEGILFTSAIWRDGPCIAAVSLEGLAPTEASSLAIKLARAQERRMAPHCPG